MENEKQNITLSVPLSIADTKTFIQIKHQHEDKYGQTSNAEFVRWLIDGKAGILESK